MIRAAAHVHTDWSYDGSWELEALVRELKRRGYGAVLTAEHDRTFDPERWERYRAACAVAEGALRIPVCPGIEYSDADNVVHVPVWGVDTPESLDKLATDLLADRSIYTDADGVAHTVDETGFRASDNEAIPGDREAAGTQTVAVECPTNKATVREGQGGGTVPRLHGVAVVLEEGRAVTDECRRQQQAQVPEPD